MFQLRKSVSGGVKDSQKRKASLFDCFYVMPPLKNGDITGLRGQLAGDFHAGGDHLRIGCLDGRQQFPRFADGLLLIGGFQADAFAFAVDLLTGIVVAAFAGLIDVPVSSLMR